MKIKSISSIGEFELIELIKNKFGNRQNKNIIAEIGDDSFCFKSGKDYICVTKDLLIEDVHFKKDWICSRQLGKKAIEVNVSDIAAMGNVNPKYVFIGLAINPETPYDFVCDLYKGFKESCSKYKMTIAGGDTVKSDKIMISITVIGYGKEKIVKRNGARNNNLIGVTSTFGDAGAGIKLLHKYGMNHKYNNFERFLIFKHNEPQARLKESQKISKYINSLTDASDGLYTSIELLVKSSGKGADIYIEKIPISQNLRKVFKNNKTQTNLALFGAEDYELVFTVPKEKSQKLKKIVPSISYIGKINSSKKIKYFNNGKEQAIKYAGFKHF
jgi:thiamine-monophosphate kinase